MLQFNSYKLENNKITIVSINIRLYIYNPLIETH